MNNGVNVSGNFMARRSSKENFISINRKIPYGLFNVETDDNQNITKEFNEILGFYSVYKEGANFIPEGTQGGKIIAEDMRHLLVSNLIDKQARFLFANTPTITANIKGAAEEISDEDKNAISIINSLMKKVLSENKFEAELLKAAKDCFIGKRVAVLLNFNEEDGITISFMNSISFLFEYDGAGKELTMFVAFQQINNTNGTDSNIFFKKRYDKIEGVIYLSEVIVDSSGNEIEVITDNQAMEIDFIPAVVILNDGLLDDTDGESDVQTIEKYESRYSKLSAADIDAMSRSMNPIKWIADGSRNTVSNLPHAAGSVWDLQTSHDSPNNQQVKTGVIESNMAYSGPLKATLDRIKSMAYNNLDIPDVDLEKLSGVITSGKGMRAIYWNLIIRCQEKMKEWGPKIEQLMNMLIDASFVYSGIAKQYIEDVDLIPIDYEVLVEQNTPIPEDEDAEKEIAMSEVSLQIMSRKSYMSKWRGLSEKQIEAELQQIALEREILDEGAFSHGSDFGVVGEE